MGLRRRRGRCVKNDTMVYFFLVNQPILASLPTLFWSSDWYLDCSDGYLDCIGFFTGETDDGDSDTSHALGASSLIGPSSPYGDDDEDADPLCSARLTGVEDQTAPSARAKLDGTSNGPVGQVLLRLL